MRNIFKILIFILGISIFSSCQMFIDKDITNELSVISTKPIMEIQGKPILSLKVGENYIDAGVKAYGGDSIFDSKIVEGEVNPNEAGFYVVTYEGVNGFNWKSYAFRAVLVYENDDPYFFDISGTYTGGNILDVAGVNPIISKYTEDAEVTGYWKMTNVWKATGIEFPIVFADLSDGNYGVVPGVHPTKGKYTGTGHYIYNPSPFVNDEVEFTITTFDKNGDPVPVTHKWKLKN